MSDYVFLVGDDYESNNKEYVSINSDKGKLISIALAVFRSITSFLIMGLQTAKSPN